MERLLIRRPWDMHVHFRQGEVLDGLVRETARYCAGALVMPNTSPPILTYEDALEYEFRIKNVANRAGYQHFKPLMALKLAQNTSEQTIWRAASSINSIVKAVKLYPRGVTTNTSDGVSAPLEKNLQKVYAAMQEVGMVLSIHCEDPNADVFAAEEQYLPVVGLLTHLFPDLRIVLEHVSTRAAVEFVQQSGPNVAATITAHHMRFNLNHLLKDGLRPHLYCKPILKTENDRQAVHAAAVSGNPTFFLGSDSAPHPKNAKETSCCAAGVFTAPILIPLLAESFEDARMLDRLEGFASIYGPQFYGIVPRQSAALLTLVRETEQIPHPRSSEAAVLPLAGESLRWRIQY